MHAYVLSPHMKKQEVGQLQTNNIRFQGEDIMHCQCGSADCGGILN